MGKTEERLVHLKSDIEELRITAEKSQVAHNVAREYTKLLDELDLSNSKNLPILVHTTKNGLARYMEYLRDRVNIISKVSPKTAKRLELQLIRHEELGNHMISVFKSAKTTKQLDKKTNSPEFLNVVNEITISSIRVEEAITTCYNFLLDTIEYLEVKE